MNGQKKIIEHFGDYYHGTKHTGKTEQQNESERINHFKKFGYSTLIIWEKELKNESELIDKIIAFNNGGIKNG